MKIAILIQSYPPMVSGAALFVERLAKGMAACGHKVLVLAASDRSYPYQRSQPNLVVKRFSSSRNPFRVGQRLAIWPHRQIVKELAEFDPDVIHLHEPLQLAISSQSFSRKSKIPVILTIHAFPSFVSASFPFGYRIGNMVENGLWRYGRWVLSRCNGVVVGTQTAAKMIYDRTGLYPQVISCGVDLSNFSPAPKDAAQENVVRCRLGIPQGAPIILHVGRLDKGKQVEKVVQASARAMQHTPALLLIVGDGTEKDRLKELCAQLGIGDRSHFTGFVSADDVLAGLYRASAVFVMASEIETQGMVLLEAAACALPIVAYQATSLHEIVHEGINGFLLPHGDEAGMARRIRELIQDPDRAHRMGQMGRRIVENHAIEKTFAAYEELYRAVI